MYICFRANGHFYFQTVSPHDAANVRATKERIFTLTWEALLVDVDEICPFQGQTLVAARAKEAEKTASNPGFVRRWAGGHVHA